MVGLADLIISPFMLRAFVATAAVAALAPLVGTFLVARRLALLGDGLGHLAFAGVGLAFLLGLPAGAGAAALALVSVLVLQYLLRRGVADTALAIIFYTGIAAGLTLAALAGRFGGAIYGYLFGSVLTLSTGETLLAVAAASVGVTLLALFFRPLALASLDEEAARAQGLPTGSLQLVVLLAAAAVVVLGMRIVGLLLVGALMALPVAAATQLASGFRATGLLALVGGEAAGILGLIASAFLNLPPGGAVVLFAALLWPLAHLLARAGVSLG